MMKKTICALLASLLFISAYADIIPSSQEGFCQRFKKESATQQQLASNSLNLMSFKNQGGLFNAGVCWWHSRFQRNVIYLAIFKPELKRPNTLEARDIIRKIRTGRNVVTIPGFKNFNEFSEHYKNEIIKELEEWQLFDGIVLSAWINGLKGNTQVPASKLESMMDTLFDYVSKDKKIAYQKLQIKGITAHAWLVVGMKKTQSGYDLGVIDSNSPNMTLNYTYKKGDLSFNSKSYGNFVPYLEFTREENRLVQVAKSFCNKSTLASLPNEADMDRDDELDLMEHNQVY